MHTHNQKARPIVNSSTNLLNPQKNKLIFIGELNATNKKWHCKSNNKRGLELQATIFENNMLIENDNSPTLRKRTNKIDIVAASNEIYNKITNFSIYKSFTNSDHFMVNFYGYL